MDIFDFKFKFKEMFEKDNEVKIPDYSTSNVYPIYFQAFPIKDTRDIHYELIQNVVNGPIALEFHIERSHYWEFEEMAK